MIGTLQRPNRRIHRRIAIPVGSRGCTWYDGDREPGTRVAAVLHRIVGAQDRNVGEPDTSNPEVIS